MKGFDYVTDTSTGILLRTITGSHGSSVGIVTMLQAGRYRVPRYFALQRNIQTGSGIHRDSCMMASALVLEIQQRITTHLHLVTRLRMSGATPPLPLRVCMVCSVETSPCTEPLTANYIILTTHTNYTLSEAQFCSPPAGKSEPHPVW